MGAAPVGAVGLLGPLPSALHSRRADIWVSLHLGAGGSISVCVCTRCARESTGKYKSPLHSRFDTLVESAARSVSVHIWGPCRMRISVLASRRSARSELEKMAWTGSERPKFKLPNPYRTRNRDRNSDVAAGGGAVPFTFGYVRCVCGRVQTGVAQKLSILKQCSKLAPCARLSRPQASQPRLDYSAHPP